MSLSTVILIGAALGVDIHVPGDQPSITAAIAAAVDGDTITVAPGVWNESIDPQGKRITIRGTDPDDKAVVWATIVDAGGAGPVARFVNGESWTTVLDGLTLRNGSGELIGAFRYGGGVFVNNGGRPAIRNCAIKQCTADVGGGVASVQSSVRLTRCTIMDNTARDGGGVAAHSSDAWINGCRIRDNVAQFGGGGVSLHTWDGTMVNCLVNGNESTGRAGGLWIECGSTGLVANTTVTQNTAPLGPAVYCESTTLAHIVNSIIWDHDGPSILDVTDSVTTVSHAIVEGGFPGDSVLDTDPQFVQPDMPNLAQAFRLQPGSAGRDTGDDALVPSIITVDLEGDDRFLGPAVDLGPYEHEPTEAELPEDTNADGIVDTIDLLGTLANWGGCNGCVWDVDDSGWVNFDDVLRILARWGMP